MSRYIRAFIAAEIPATPSIKRMQQQLAETVDGARLTSSGQFHLTLKFLGDVTYEEVPAITRAMQSVVQRHTPIAGQLSGMGAFPDAQRARVSWIGVRPVREIQQLAYDLEQELEVLRFPRENKEFKPHLTVARFHRPPRDPGFAEFLERHRETTFGEFQLDELILFQSEMQRGGPLYTPLAAVDLEDDEPSQEEE